MKSYIPKLKLYFSSLHKYNSKINVFTFQRCDYCLLVCLVNTGLLLGLLAKKHEYTIWECCFYCFNCRVEKLWRMLSFFLQNCVISIILCQYRNLRKIITFSERLLFRDFKDRQTRQVISSAFRDSREKITARNYARFFTIQNVSEYTAPRSIIPAVWQFRLSGQFETNSFHLVGMRNIIGYLRFPCQ